MKFIKKAFTLSEALIAMAVIGVIAAITIPNLVKDYQQKQTVIQLKKVYSEFAQAVILSEVKNGSKLNWDYSLSQFDFFNEYLSPYITLSQNTKGSENVVYYEASGAEESSLLASRDSAYIVTLASGTVILAGTETSSLRGKNERKGYAVDINGYKKPNKFGRDAFYFTIDSELGVIPTSWDDGEILTAAKSRDELKDGPSSYNYQCNKKGRGVWCAALIMADNWQIKSDYPW